MKPPAQQQRLREESSTQGPSENTSNPGTQGKRSETTQGMSLDKRLGESTKPDYHGVSIGVSSIPQQRPLGTRTVVQIYTIIFFDVLFMSNFCPDHISSIL